MPRTRKPSRLPQGAPLEYEPENEQGVVFLFSHLARKRFGLRIERIQAGFPDCIAISAGRTIRIEFEYESRNFESHGHDPRGCDWVVCWIHNWSRVPSGLRVVELRRLYGLGFNVWVAPVAGEYAAFVDKAAALQNWSVPASSRPGDLLLFYRKLPEGFIKDIFKVTGDVTFYPKARWRNGTDWQAPLRRVCRLEAPLHFSELKQHPQLGVANFVRGQVRGRYCASEFWPELYRYITARNPSRLKQLQSYGPDRLAGG
jgi:hypothetical protein